MPTLPAFARRSFLLAAALLLVAAPPARSLDPDRAATQYVTKLWQAEHGLPHDSVLAVAQTPDGHVWCGTEGGLARFDGQRFTVFNRENTPAFRVNPVVALLADRRGRLWIGTGSAGAVLYEGGEFRRFSTADGLIDDHIDDLLEDRDGAIWVSTTKGISRIDDEGVRNFTTRDGLPTDRCRMMRQDAAGRVWMASGRGLVCYHEGEFRTYGRKDGLPTNQVRSLALGRDDVVWVGTSGEGLLCWKNGTISTYASPKQLGNSYVQAVHEDRDGNLWVGTDDGVTRWRDGEQIDRIPRETFSGRIVAFREDARGDLWIGGVNGLCRLGDGRCVTFTPTEGLAGEMVWSVHEDRRGRLWVGTARGLSVREGGQWQTYNADHGLPNTTITGMAEDPDGTMWFGTPSGLARFRDGKFEKFGRDRGRQLFVLGLYAGRSGEVWVGTNGSGVYRLRDGLFEPVPLVSPPTSEFPRVFHEDARGDLWIGTVDGLVRWSREGPTIRYTTRDGLSSDRVLAIHEDAAGAIWVGTDDGGLNRLRDGRWTSYTIENGLPCNAVYHILEDGPHFWISSNKGIIRFDKAELDRGRIGPTLLLGKGDGMRNVEGNGGLQSPGCRSADGSLWFATARGVVRVQPGRVRGNTVPPTVLVDRAVIDEMPRRVARPLTVAPGAGRFEFDYAAVELTAPERVRYRTRLEGFDQHWVETGDRRTASYTNLPPGRYRFQVVACNGDGVWSEPTSVELVLEPHFHQTGWFLGLGVCGLTALVFGCHLIRTRQLRSREKHLARCVEERTRQLQTEVEEHARTGALLVQSQKMEAVGQLAGGIAHDFNNLLTVINGYADLLLGDETIPESGREVLAEVGSAGRRAAELTRQLLAFSRRQILEPKVLEPNAVVAETERMLRRMIGDHILLKLDLDPLACRVKVDPVQLQQVLLNLAVNARDVMPLGGTCTIATRNATLTAESARPGFDAPPGDYVLLSVADTGHGMTPEVMTRVFEPFFTTKPAGHGTGLGLATVYGIVRQSGGQIAVESEVGVGTVFRVYLPRAEGETAPGHRAADPTPAPRGEETILLVEDEPCVRAVARHVLRASGYCVLEAEDGESALQVARQHVGPIDLLISDVMMPNMGGRQLAEELHHERPDTRLMFMSGYSDDAILQYGTWQVEYAFLQKPYSPAALASKVRETLDG